MTGAPEDLDPIACRRLWAAVLFGGVRDAVGLPYAPNVRTEGAIKANAIRDREWIESGDFEAVTDMAGFSAADVREAIRSGRVTADSVRSPRAGA